MRKLSMKYRAPTEGRGFLGVKTHEVQGEAVHTEEEGHYTLIRSYGAKPENGAGLSKGRPLLEDFRVPTDAVISVHESEVQA